MSKVSQFLAEIKAGAIAGWHHYGILPSVTAAQAALESAWGESALSQAPNHNLFGIKGSYNGQSINFPTLEVINGQNVTVNAQFRKYPSWSASVEDHGSFFHDNSRYHSLIGMTDYVQQSKAVKLAGYATDPAYADKLIATIRSNDLVSWDQEALTGNVSVKPNEVHATYTVQLGDTLSGIAEKLQTSVAQLTAINQIANPNLIFVGQILKISDTAPATGTYIVKNGDALSVIAEKLGVTTDHLTTKNQIKNPNLIFPGQRLTY